MRLVIIVTYKIIFLQTDEMHVFWNHVSSVPTPNVRTYFLATLLKKFKQWSPIVFFMKCQIKQNF
jgi:hypothetical protein